MLGKSKAILGLNCMGSYDTSAALVVDGKVVAAVEEERLNRQKRSGAFPMLSIRSCLDQAGLTMDDIDAIAVAGEPSRYIYEYFLKLAIQHPRSNIFDRNLEMCAKSEMTEATIRAHTEYRGPIRFHLHHFTHWASVYYTSGTQDVASLSIDGMGEAQTVLGGAIRGGRFDPTMEIRWPHSLGILYNGISSWIGFHHRDVGKTMGLSPYGEASPLVDLFEELIQLKPDGSFRLNEDFITFGYERDTWFKGKFREMIGDPRKPGTDLTARDRNLAFAMQRGFERAVLHMANHLHETTGLDTLAISGGCGYNCLANGLITKKTGFKHLHVQPASGDTGTSIGAALYDYHQFTPSPLHYVQKDTYLGPGFDDGQIQAAVEASGYRWSRVEAPAEEAARLLAEGEIVGWFQGRMEFGPRALGNRSILAAPFPAGMKDKVNRDIKHREAFRPFAPAVAADHFDSYFEPCADTRYMIVATTVKPGVAAKIPAVTHVDGTVRIQSVDPELNPAFHDVIQGFGKRTGVYVLLNTSFNDNDMPVVCFPEDAIQCLRQTGLNHVFIGNYWIRKDLE